MTRMNKALLLALAIGAAFIRLPLRGDITGVVDGLVKNATTGELLEGVKITVVYSKSESMTYTLVSDKKGHFYKSGLVPGSYNLTFEKEGYVPQSGSVRAVPGLATPMDVRMEPGSGAAPGGISVGKIVSGGSELLSAGRYDEAVVKFSEAITKAPSEAVLYYYRGYGLERSGKSDQALEDYRKAIELKPDFILPLTRSGIVLAKKGDFDKASEFYRRAVDLKGQDPEVFYNYGVCLVNTGKKEEARGTFERLLAFDPYYSDGYYQLAIILLGSGDSAKAKALLQKFVELDPDNPNTALAKEILKSLN
jgi:Tfp pilus assembly protein PilF